MNTDQFYKVSFIICAVFLLAYMGALVYKQWNENFLIAAEVKADIQRKNDLNETIKKKLEKTPDPAPEKTNWLAATFTRKK